MRTTTVLAAAILALAACSTPPIADLTEPSVLRARAYIRADYDEVWRRFTQAEQYADWYSAPCLRFEATPGGVLEWGTPERSVYRGTLRSIDEGRGLVHTFQFVGFGFEEPPTPVDIAIIEQGETVLVSIRHDCTAAPRTAAMISAVGWTKSLSRLKTLLETGTAMPWPAD